MQSNFAALIRLMDSLDGNGYLVGMPIVRCPTCRKSGEWFADKWGPFCSQRCKLLDLGKWLDEDNKISEPLRPDHFAAYENLPDGESLDRPDLEP